MKHVPHSKESCHTVRKMMIHVAPVNEWRLMHMKESCRNSIPVHQRSGVERKQRNHGIAAPFYARVSFLCEVTHSYVGHDFFLSTTWLLFNHNMTRHGDVMLFTSLGSLWCMTDARVGRLFHVWRESLPTVCCSVLQCVAVCSSVFQCVAV